MEKMHLDHDWPESLDYDDTLYAIVFERRKPFEQAYVYAYGEDEEAAKKACGELYGQLLDSTTDEDDVSVYLLETPKESTYVDALENARYGANQPLQVTTSTKELLLLPSCRVLDSWRLTNLTESQRKRKKLKNKIQTTYTTGDIALNIKRFNQAMGTDFNNPSTAEAQKALGFPHDAYVFDGEVQGSGSDSAGDAGSGEGGGMGESLDEASSSLTPLQKMQAFNSGQRKENLKACSDQKLQMYHDICRKNHLGYALGKIRDEMIRRGMTPPQLQVPVRQFPPIVPNDIYLNDCAFVIAHADEPHVIAGIVQFSFSDTDLVNGDHLKDLVLYIMYALSINRPDVADFIRSYILNNTTVTSEELNDYIQREMIDKKANMERLSEIVSIQLENAEKESLTEAKRIVKRYYIRPQNIFCSNKNDILEALVKIGDANCSVYSLKNLEDHDDVHLLKPSDIIYYYDGGILYDKNHVKVMDYDLFVKNEEDRKKFADVDKVPEDKFDKEYEDRLVESAFDVDYEPVDATGKPAKDRKFICCICGEECEGYDNNPDPVKEEGRCCDACNSKFVIPARIEQMLAHEGNDSAEPLGDEEE